ncbi:MAG: M23 family metallopeptidase [Alphaproteobacteria bacterium]|nr:M23 family metallopeptidase [Alphaproteobacteria bacterium]
MWRKNFFLSVFGLCMLMPLGVYCEGFLQPISFPKTFDDLSLADRMAVKAEGYAPFADLSAYDVITILETDAGIAAEIAENENQTCVSDTWCQEPDQTPDTKPTTPSIPTKPGTSKPTAPSLPVENDGGGSYCAIRNSEIPANQQNPVGKPVFERDYKFCSRYGYRQIYGKNDPHHGFDIGCTEANFGNPVFAIADGVVEKAHVCSKGSSAGNYILINHKNGFKTYYMHLDKMFVTEGQQVSAGCQIAEIGYTGGAKANKQAFANEACPKMRKSISHLHYEIHYTGNQTSLTANGRTIPIKHGFSGNNSVDPAYFMDVPQHM